MKKVILASAIALFGMVSAQESETPGFVKGDTFITGAVGFTNSTQGEVKNNTFTIAPSVGYFVSPNIAVGVRAGYTNMNETDKTTSITVENESDTFAVGAFGRYYYTPASRFSIFGELNANYGNQKFTNTVGGVSTDAKFNAFDVNIAPGVNYFISKNFALEATWGVLGYSSFKQDVAGAESQDNFNIGLDLNDLSLGLVYKF
ncbi:outer membrane beta-barrel protein [Frigoriflavimonas asaccharolytica]|uniref:Outer membrane protein n=1 Tax=Frigoriflavimonas asaccharolytica TaxID=2735899 RepID=A0A8J8G672_9FLAO|nr:outer membrane beta-barrel protein [Frigoriflavimonas asaccharolytica]NRS91991.1 outer membrane protein [Frigoriflavimonas asaccharolytica]